MKLGMSTTMIQGRILYKYNGSILLLFFCYQKRVWWWRHPLSKFIVRLGLPLLVRE
jgi:hypothetical protein